METISSLENNLSTVLKPIDPDEKFLSTLAHRLDRDKTVTIDWRKGNRSYLRIIVFWMLAIVIGIIYLIIPKNCQ